MTKDLRLVHPPQNTRAPASVGAILGSFDPPHRGHLRIVSALLQRFDLVLVLIPTLHFDKHPCFPHNATFPQRLAMLEWIGRLNPARIGVGLSHEVLFVTLATRIAGRYPGAQVGFGMGSDTFARFINSPEYYRRLGRTWTVHESRVFDELQRNIVLVERRDEPALSSTQIRLCMSQLRQRGATAAEVHRTLDTMTSSHVTDCMLSFGLYAATNASSAGATPVASQPRRG